MAGLGMIKGYLTKSGTSNPKTSSPNNHFEQQRKREDAKTSGWFRGSPNHSFHWQKL
jgi:hypothetical protein